MIDEYVDKGRVKANVGWTAVVAMMAVGWAVILLAPDHWKVGGMFAASSCATSALAAVLHIRCYIVRLACLVRATGAVERKEGPSPVRGL